MAISNETDAAFRPPTAAIADYLQRSISISRLLGKIWSGRMIVGIATAMGLAYGVYVVHASGPSYMAAMRISPAESDTGLGGGGSGAGGLLAGLTGGSSAAQVPKYVQFTYALSSVEVARALDQKYDMLCRIYHGDCDARTHQWERRTGLREWITSALARLSRLPDPNAGPRPLTDLAAYIGGQIVIEQPKKTDSVINLYYTNRDPKFASEFLSIVVKAANDYVRAQSRETQKRYVEYLSESAANTTNVEQRQAIDTLLLQEERQLMMTQVDVPYAAQILDGPNVTPVNHALKFIATFALVGLVTGTLIALLRDWWPRRWRVW